MPGFRHSALDDISRIRQDLRDRYQDGFPILKELLQNADDAGASEPDGAAKQLVLVLAKKGLTGASHPLLKTAGLALLNDGAFTANDAISITSLGMSNKAGQAGAAGKFGLGLKSVFHWAEAFFYFSPHTFLGGHKHQAAACDFLNPWWSREIGDGRHQDWEQSWQSTREADLAAFRNLTQQALNGGRWFGLWIPLRQQGHLQDAKGEIKPIEQRFPQPVLQELLGKEWEIRLAETLPLLRRLRIVRVCEQDGGNLADLARFSLSEDSRRMCFGLNIGREAAQPRHQLSGSVHVGNAQANSCHFVGFEQTDNTARLGEIKRLGFWPNQTAIGADGADRQVPEKAEPHGAVVFTRQPANGNGTLRLQHAVFLPLGEPEAVSCDGGWRYYLYLHGFFFVDSGRRHIQPFDNLKDGLTPDQATSELEVIKLWNCTLLREVVAPLVLPSLDAFVNQERMEAAEVGSLVRAMQKSKMLEGILPWVCRGQRFVCRLRPGGANWELETWDANRAQPARWIELPQPRFAESELFDLLPTLKDLCGRAVVSLKGKPCLADGKPQSPSDAELAGLLASVRASSFENAAHLDFLLELIPDKADELEPDSGMAKALVNLANLLTSRPLPEDKDLAKHWKEFFNRLPHGAFVRLPVESPDAKLQAALEGHNMPVALVWADWHEAEGKGRIPWSALSPLLRRLGSLRLDDKEALKQRSEIAIRLLSACDDQPQSWPAELAKLPLFACRAADGAWVAVSHADLQAAQAENRLFTRGNDWAANLARAVPGLQPVLVDQSLANALHLDARACAANTCVESLKRAARLATEFANRKPLFDQLLAEATPADSECWPALRYLLHGQLAEWDNQSTLFCEPQQTNACVKLTRLALEAAGQTWRLIPHAIGAKLRLDENQKRLLNLGETSAEEVEALVKEIGPEKVNCASLTTEECDTILLQFSDVETLRGLNIHETAEHSRVRISGHTYVDDGTFKNMPPEFDSLVTRLRPRTGYGRFDTVDGLVGKLSWEAVIQIALDQSEPSQWHATILAAIGQLGTLRAELCARVREVAWLPLTAGGAAKPADVLHLPGAEEELDRLPPEVLNGRTPILRLAESVRNHERFETFLKVVLPSNKDAMAVLADLLKPHPACSTGLSGEWSADEVADWVAVLGDGPQQALPIAGLVKALHGNEAIRELLPSFLQPLDRQISEMAYAQVLIHLATRLRAADAGQLSGLVNVAFRYLHEIDAAGPDFARRVLACEGVQLPNSAGHWKAPGELAPPVGGLSADATLDSKWASAMPTLVKDLKEPMPLKGQTQQVFDPGTWETMAAEARKLFEPWRQFLPAPEPIGAFLSLISSPEPVGRLASEFFQTHRPESVSQWFQEHHPGLLDQLRTSLGNPVPLILLVRGKTVRVHSLLGEIIEADRQQNPDRLILGSDPSMEVGSAILMNGVLRPGPKRRVLRFLPMDPGVAGLSVPEAVRCLQEAAEQLIERCLQRTVDLAGLFEGLSESAQVEVQVAQSLVVESALGLLRQIGGGAHASVKKALEQWDKAHRSEASAESLGLPSQLKKANEERRLAKAEVRRLLQGDAEVQSALLKAVRQKLAQYQYDAASVPFELWQNADDAVRELETLGIEPDATCRDAFLMTHSGDQMAILHFGRLINQYRLPGGSSREDLGFNRDLEKMVVQSISDKTDVAAQTDASVTGKFGLGFKSVFLVSDAPEVLSGSLDFVIRGGIYPVRLDAARRDALVAVLKELAPDHWRRGTLIRLPWREDGQIEPDEVMGLFRRLAPLLVVFSRRLKRLRLFEPDTVGLEITWKPEKVADQIEVGALEHLHGDARRALVLSHPVGNDRAQILFGLGSDGFVALLDDVPVFWVTAPTRATPGCGFAVNGPFEPDVGRVQLALDSKRNEELADELARGLAGRLKALWDKAVQDWSALRSKLGLASSATALVFWESLWELVGRGFAEKCPKSDSNPVGTLARRILWQSEHAGLRNFYSECAALPTGLWGEHQCLTRLADMCFEAAGALDREAVFLAASRWPAFRERVHPARIVSSGRVVSVLRKLEALPHQLESLHLASVVKWEVKHADEMRADPETAARLGQLVTPDFLKRLKDGKPEEREEHEHKALTDLLPKVLFQAADGSWRKPAELVVAEGEGVDEDEQMRAAFAPPECRLNQAYAGPSLSFFLACRAKLEATVEAMAEWALHAASESERIAVLRYLLTGSLGTLLGEKLRDKRDNDIWLWQLQTSLAAWFEAAIPNESERREILAHQLRLYEEQLRQWTQPRLLQQEPQEEPEAEREPWTVRQLWLWWEQQGKPVGDYVLEGEANWPLFHGGNVPGMEQRKKELKRLLLEPTSPEGKLLWYRLFGYACLVSAGRHMTELRRFWLERLQPEGFWERTADGDFSEATRDIFEKAVTAEFTNMDAGGEQAYFWRRVFYDIRKVQQMVHNDFPAVLLDLVHQGHGEHLPQFLRTGDLPGPEQPRWIGTFGQSADTPLGFIVRELFRLGVITDEAVRPYAFYVCRPVLRALAKIGWIPDADSGFSGDAWLQMLKEDAECGPKLLPFFDIPLLHMGITHRGDKMPSIP